MKELDTLSKIYYAVFLYCILCVAFLLSYGIYRTLVPRAKEPVKCEVVPSATKQPEPVKPNELFRRLK